MMPDLPLPPRDWWRVLGGWGMAILCPLFVGWALAVGAPPAATAALIVFALLLCALTVVDLKYYLLPDVFVLPGLALGLVLSPWALGLPWQNSVAGAAVGFLFFGGLKWGYARWRGREGLGLGDVKLLACLGAWVGASNLPLVLLLASALALPASWVAQRTRGAHAPIPFGPALALGAWLTLLYSPVLWNTVVAFRLMFGQN